MIENGECSSHPGYDERLRALPRNGSKLVNRKVIFHYQLENENVRQISCYKSHF